MPVIEMKSPTECVPPPMFRSPVGLLNEPYLTDTEPVGFA